MSMRSPIRACAALGAAAAMFVVGVVVAQASGSSGSTNVGPAPGGGSTARAAAVSPAGVPVAFVPSPQSQTLQSVVPCRIVDTRVAGGKLAAHATRSFTVGGTTGFSGQGGAASGCGIPTSATAVAISIIAVAPASGGFLTAWPAGSARPNASVLNFGKGVTTNTGLTVQTRPDVNPALSVFNGSAAALNVVIDVYGYYEPQTHLIILSDGTVWYGNSTHVTAVNHTANTGNYTLTFDRSLTGCDVLATDNGNPNVRAAATWGGTSLTVNTYARSGASFTPLDESFQIFIAC